MTTRTTKLKLLKEIQDLLRVKEEDLGRLPDIIRHLLNAASVSCLVAFSFDPKTSEIRQVALSSVPRIPEAYSKVAQAATTLSQQFQNIAVEVAKHVGEQGRVARTERPREDDERGDGPGAERHGVGEVAVEGPCLGPPDE